MQTFDLPGPLEPPELLSVSTALEECTVGWVQ